MTQGKRVRVWLADLLTSGPVAAASILAQAAERGTSERTLHRAKLALGVRSVKRSGGWFWQLDDNSIKQAVAGDIKAVGTSVISGSVGAPVDIGNLAKAIAELRRVATRGLWHDASVAVRVIQGVKLSWPEAEAWHSATGRLLTSIQVRDVEMMLAALGVLERGLGKFTQIDSCGKLAENDRTE